METSNYAVSFSSYSERHYEKNFTKKYKNKWPNTKKIIEFLCAHIDTMLVTDRARLISYDEQAKLVKLYFVVDQRRESPKSSGNRCILYVNEALHTVEILLIYSKNDIGPPNETQKWKNEIASAFPEISKQFNLRSK